MGSWVSRNDQAVLPLESVPVGCGVKGHLAVKVSRQGGALPPSLAHWDVLGTCAGRLAAMLGLRQARLLQTALQEAVVVQSPGPCLGALGGTLAVQAHVVAPGAREAAGGRQAGALSPHTLLFLQVLGPLGSQWIQVELREAEAVGRQKGMV